MIRISDSKLSNEKINNIKYIMTDIINRIVSENSVALSVFSKEDIEFDQVDFSKVIGTHEIHDILSNEKYYFNEYFMLCKWMSEIGYKYTKSRGTFKLKNATSKIERLKIYNSLIKLLSQETKINIFLNGDNFSISQHKIESGEQFEEELSKYFQFFLSLTNTIKSAFVYEKYRCKFRKELIDAVDLSICPYCNDEKIEDYDYIDDIGTKSTAEVDHFLSQSYYPLFSLSLGNFIISGVKCNQKFKRNNILEICNPRIEGFDDGASFHVSKMDITSYLKNHESEIGDQIQIVIKIEDTEQNEKKKLIENSIALFQLKERYDTKTSKKEVAQLYHTFRDFYSRSYQKYVSDFNNENEEVNDENLIRNVFIGYYDDSQIDNERGKFKKDILNQLLKMRI